jgi:hypothetical protein
MPGPKRTGQRKLRRKVAPRSTFDLMLDRVDTSRLNARGRAALAQMRAGGLAGSLKEMGVPRGPLTAAIEAAKAAKAGQTAAQVAHKVSPWVRRAAQSQLPPKALRVLVSTSDIRGGAVTNAGATADRIFKSQKTTKVKGSPVRKTKPSPPAGSPTSTDRRRAVAMRVTGRPSVARGKTRARR